MLLALSTGHKIGLLVFAGIFIVFALASAVLIPRFRPGFPGRGLPFFVLATIGLFAAMFTAVLVFGREGEEAEAGGEKTTETNEAAKAERVSVSETEFKITLAETTLDAGSYEFDAKNTGKLPHDLAIDGPGVDEKTPVFNAGQSSTLKVTLKPGTYDFYCSVPGHKQAGMDLKVKVS